MDATIYHNPRCSTSRKALARLQDAGIEPRIVRYLTDPPTRDELIQMIRDAGIPVSAAIRRREPLFAELALHDAADDRLLDAMSAHPRLIERPFVVTDKGTRLARPLESIEEII